MYRLSEVIVKSILLHTKSQRSGKQSRLLFSWTWQMARTGTCCGRRVRPLWELNNNSLFLSSDIQSSVKVEKLGNSARRRNKLNKIKSILCPEWQWLRLRPKSSKLLPIFLETTDYNLPLICHYLCGRLFIILANHDTLEWLKSFTESHAQEAKWMEKLAELNFAIQHPPGTKHSFSRRSPEGIWTEESSRDGASLGKTNNSTTVEHT